MQHALQLVDTGTLKEGRIGCILKVGELAIAAAGGVQFGPQGGGDSQRTNKNSANYTDMFDRHLLAKFSANFVDRGVSRGQRVGTPTAVKFSCK
jgi:hypothetical protein